LDEPVALLDRPDDAGGAPERRGKDEERDGHAERVAKEEEDAVPERAGDRRERKDSAEDRPDARGPPGGERHADEERLVELARGSLVSEPPLDVEAGNPQ